MSTVRQSFAIVRASICQAGTPREEDVIVTYSKPAAERQKLTGLMRIISGVYCKCDQDICICVKPS